MRLKHSLPSLEHTRPIKNKKISIQLKDKSKDEESQFDGIKIKQFDFDRIKNKQIQNIVIDQIKINQTNNLIKDIIKKRGLVNEKQTATK